MRTALLLLLTILYITSSAQQVGGLVKDENGALISGATASLIRVADSVVVKLAVTKADGAYQFSSVKEGRYKVMISYVGYRPASSPVFQLTAAGTTLAELTLAKSSGTMGNVTVTAQKQLVEVRADKTVLNVEGTVNAIGSDALELLRKSPGILIDKDDNISLAGKNGIQVYIDGKPNPLSGQDLAGYLKSLQSAQIEAIELITNPSAKYDAAGNAGIINIRLKKNRSLGTNGSVNAGWNIGVYAKYNTGFSLNYRNKNINIFSTYSFNYGLNRQRIDFERTVLDSLFDQRGVFNDLRNAHNYKAGADYFINKKNTIGIILSGMLSDPEMNSNSNTIISNTTTNTVNRLLLAGNNSDTRRRNLNINLNYNYTDPKGTTFSVNADRGAYDVDINQLQSNHYKDASGQTSLYSVVNRMVPLAEININSLKGDYERPFAKGKLGIGVKSAWVKTDNDFKRYDIDNGTEELDKDRSNRFVYKEEIKAGYVNYNRQFKGLMIQAGVRVENTISDGVSTGQKFDGSGYVLSESAFRRSYTDLFPSAALTFNKNPKRQWGFTYSRRIDRPAYQDLNPFEFKLDEYSYMKGNVNLRPQYTNSFGATYMHNFKLNIGINYSHVNDMFTQLIDTAEKSKAFVSKRNLATQDIISVSISYPFQYKSYSLFASINSNYSMYEADFGEGRKVDLEAFGFSLFMQQALKFTKKKTWTAELSGFYNAPTIYNGTFKGKAMYNLDAGLSKQLFNGKATVKAAVTDVFKVMRFRAVSEFAGQTMRFHVRQENRQFKLSLSYRFGNNGVKPARQRSTGSEEETKRVQSGGGMIGN